MRQTNAAENRGPAVEETPQLVGERHAAGVSGPLFFHRQGLLRRGHLPIAPNLWVSVLPLGG